MKVTGFSLVRNANYYDYPIVEAVNSILPVCDDFVIAVGKSHDGTRKLIEDIQTDKIKIVDTVWDDSLREGGKVLAVETDKAFQEIPRDSDWAFYIQGDEIIHEKYLDVVVANMEKYKDDDRVDGLLFDYKHFYGSYDYVGTSLRWYRKEIRVIKNNPEFYSYRDAQGFRKGNNKKLNVIPIEACVHHYGWVRDPRAMQNKQEDFHKLWHSDEWIEKNIVKADEFDYSGIDSLELYTDSHPKVMQKRIEETNWKFEHDISTNKQKLKDVFKRFVKRFFGWEIAYKNYNIIKPKN